MKNEERIKTDIYLYLKDTALMSDINGILSKTIRDNDSHREDIVISVLSDVPIEQVQEVYVNVNIYVPDLYRNNRYEEATLRIEHLCNLSLNALRIVRGKGYRASLKSQKVHPVKDRDEHFINNKVLYQFCNE